MRCQHCDTPDMMRECRWPRPPCARRRHALGSISRASQRVEAAVIATILAALAVVLGAIALARGLL